MKPRQIALDLGHATARSRDDLIVTPANAEAVAAVDRWPDWDAPFLAVVGVHGSGRTHLASAWAERAGATLVTGPDIAALDLGGDLRALAIDDAQASDERALFHLINAARAAGTSLLMTAPLAPAAWPVRLPDLASRLRLVAVTRLAEPDDALLAGVMAKLFADRQVEIDPAVLQFLARRIERSLAAAADAVERLDKAAMEGKTRITRALAAQVVGKADRDGA